MSSHPSQRLKFIDSKASETEPDVDSVKLKSSQPFHRRQPYLVPMRNCVLNGTKSLLFSEEITEVQTFTWNIPIFKHRQIIFFTYLEFYMFTDNRPPVCNHWPRAWSAKPHSPSYRRHLQLSHAVTMATDNPRDTSGNLILFVEHLQTGKPACPLSYVLESPFFCHRY